jgi:hypothetical protein
MDPAAPRIISTERGLGYVFALPVEPLEAAPRAIDNRGVGTHFTDAAIHCVRSPSPRRRNHPVGRPAHPLRIEN